MKHSASEIQIFSELPEETIWQSLRLFTYKRNIQRHAESRGLAIPTDDVCDAVSGAMQQAYEFFTSSKNVGLSANPLLTYYGVTNILNATSIIMSALDPKIQHHGMTLEAPSDPSASIGDFSARIQGGESGAFKVHLAAMEDASKFPYGEPWSLKEIVGSIPDMLSVFTATYQGTAPFCIPIQEVLRKTGNLDRIARSDMDSFAEVSRALDRIVGLSEMYLTKGIQELSDFIILRRKLDYDDVTITSLSRQRFLRLYHSKKDVDCSMPVDLLFLVGTYILGMIARYHPGRWSRFVMADDTGERLLVEQFLTVARRMVPNLALNRIYGRPHIYVTERQGILDLKRDWSKKELVELIQQVQKSDKP